MEQSLFDGVDDGRAPFLAERDAREYAGSAPVTQHPPVRAETSLIIMSQEG